MALKRVVARQVKTWVDEGKLDAERGAALLADLAKPAKEARPVPKRDYLARPVPWRDLRPGLVAVAVALALAIAMVAGDTYLSEHGNPGRILAWAPLVLGALAVLVSVGARKHAEAVLVGGALLVALDPFLYPATETWRFLPGGALLAILLAVRLSSATRIWLLVPSCVVLLASLYAVSSTWAVILQPVGVVLLLVHAWATVAPGDGLRMVPFAIFWIGCCVASFAIVIPIVFLNGISHFIIRIRSDANLDITNLGTVAFFLATIVWQGVVLLAVVLSPWLSLLLADRAQGVQVRLPLILPHIDVTPRTRANRTT